LRIGIKVDNKFYIPLATSKRFQCFVRDAKFDLSEVHSGYRTSVRRLRIDSMNMLIGFVHGVDIRNNDSETRQSFAEELGEEIRFVQDEKKSNRIILIGDFNMNPYDRGMNIARGLNAMSTRKCVKNGVREYHEKYYDFYYNPMSSKLGDESPGPPGTVHDLSNQGMYGWSMLDQVLINHSLLETFKAVDILETAGTHKLVNSLDRPDKTNYSDHLPLLVKLSS